MRNKRFFLISITIVVILLIPLIAMQFTDEVNWSLLDFVAAGIILICMGLLVELVSWKISNRILRITLILVILIILLLIWTELAVGIFGTPLAGS